MWLVYSSQIKLIWLKRGRKCISKFRTVTTEEGEKFAQEQELMYFEVSAKESTNVQKSFKTLTKKLLGPLEASE